MTVLECRVSPGRMQEFVAQVQQWEQDARRLEHAPEFHGVYLLESDPSRVLVVTQFANKAAATAFSESGLPERFRARVEACTDVPPDEADGFDLFYAQLNDGTRIIFGEDA
jgi:heme-degrading monooxygenase HmoA